MIKRFWKPFYSLIFTLSILMGSFQIQPATATQGREFEKTAAQSVLLPFVTQSTRNDFLASLDAVPPPQADGEILTPGQHVLDFTTQILPKALASAGESTAPAPEIPSAELDPSAVMAMPDPLLNFQGVSNLFGGWPPDTQGDIGPDHYVQWINLHFAIWQINKTTNTAALVYGPVPGNTLFQGFGGSCETTNDGDPITLFDPLAGRWLMSQFALPNYPNGPFYQCVAISKTSNPLSGWYRYEFESPVNKMNDYPKFGVWPDAYYLSVNQFEAGTGNWAGAGAAALEREAMLNGVPARMVYFDLFAVNDKYGGMLPADFDGTLAPPAGAPGFFAEWDDSAMIPPSDALRIWEFNADWGNPYNSTFGIFGNPNTIINTSNVDPDMCAYARNCIPQPGTTMRLDAISDRLMHRLQYRNFGAYQTLVSNHTVDVFSNNLAGIHWFELRKTTGAWSMYQQGVLGGTAPHRWMGSIAMDRLGNMALGYSASSSTLFPSVRYNGRLATDPLGNMLQGEKTLVAGSGSQTGANRWGDYSMMGLDPQDDCTFWYTQEYVATTGSNTWTTRIGAFRFPGCTVAGRGTLQGAVTDASTLLPINQAKVEVTSGALTVSTYTAADGSYSFNLPAGTYEVSASAFGYYPQTASGVSVSTGGTTIQDLTLSPTPYYTLSGVVKDANTGWPLYAQITIPGSPQGVYWNHPITGYYSISLPGDTVFTLGVDAFVDGYLTGNFQVGPLSGNTVMDLPLNPDLAACTAPGYQWNGTCQLQAGGLVAGFVYDKNTGSGLSDAQVSNDTGGTTTSFATSLDPGVPDGFYTIFSPAGSHNFTASKSGGYQADSHIASVVLNTTIQQDFYLPAGWLSAVPPALDVKIKLDSSLTIPLNLLNDGDLAATYNIYELENFTLDLGPYEWPNFVVKPFKQTSPTAEGLGTPSPPPAAPLAAGTVIRSWTPAGATEPWGIAYDMFNGTVWVSSPAPSWGGNDRIYEFSILGVATGRSYPHTSPHSYGPADLAFNWKTGQIWAMNVSSGAGNCIYEIDPGSGYTGDFICPGGGSGFSVSQRGLTYDPVSDTYFAGGWNDQQIHRFSSTGTLLSSVNVGLNIAGLAYNPLTQHLFVLTNANPNRVYVLNVPSLYSVVGSFTISQGFPANSGAGLEFDCDGNLWAVDQTNNVVNQFQSGETTNVCTQDIPWLAESPTNGSVAPHTGQDIQVTFDASVPEVTGVGVYRAQIKVIENTPYVFPNIPVTMTVIMGDYGVSVSPDQVLLGTPGETLVFHMQVTNSGAGPTDMYQLSLGTYNWPTTLGSTLVGPLDQGESATVDVMVDVPPGATIGQSDSVVVTATSMGDGTKTDSLTLTSTVGSADLELHKTVSDGPYYKGMLMTYTLVVTNHGPTAADQVQVKDDLPESLAFVSADVPCTFAGGMLTCDLGSLANGASVTFHVTVRLLANGTITNNAWVESATWEANPGNETDFVTVEASGSETFLPMVMQN